MRTALSCGAGLLLASLLWAAGAHCAEIEDEEPLGKEPVLKDPFGARLGSDRVKAARQFGATAASEAAVESALAWLARHQEAEGYWKARSGDRAEIGACVAVTGLATSAFLGAGYTHKGGRYRDNVSRAVRWLVAQQGENGGVIGSKEFRRKDTLDGYNHPMGALAIVEAYGMTSDPELRASAQKALEYATGVHQKPGSGWRYRPQQEGDICITTWFVQLLWSGKTAGLTVDPAGFDGAAKLVDALTSKTTGRAVYERGQTAPAALNYDSKRIAPERRTAMSVVCRQKMGVARTDRLLQLSAARVLRCPPDWAAKDFYYWYYGTQACFQLGGGVWAQWNAKLRAALVGNQRKGGPMDGGADDVDGSWDIEKDPYADRAGLVYTTALGALCLEACYRYSLAR